MNRRLVKDFFFFRGDFPPISWQEKGVDGDARAQAWGFSLRRLATGCLPAPC